MKLPRLNKPFWTLRSRTAFGWAVLADRPLPIFSSFRAALNNTALFWKQSFPTVAALQRIGWPKDFYYDNDGSTRSYSAQTFRFATDRSPVDENQKIDLGVELSGSAHPFL